MQARTLVPECPAIAPRIDIATDETKNAQDDPAALQCISDAGRATLILILSDINMPGMSGLELLPVPSS